MGLKGVCGRAPLVRVRATASIVSDNRKALPLQYTRVIMP